jgi:hypothetical protein
MAGVEILAAEEVAVAFGFNFGVFFLSWFLLMLFGTFVGWIADKNNKVNGWLTGLFISCILGFVLSIGLGTLPLKPTAYETQYKVTVSDKVPMNGFLGRYEIISQEGNIYTVRERPEAPPVEKETIELQHGYWTGWENADCSVCGNFCVMAYADMRVEYCPNCGAKMDGGDGT